MPLELRLAAVIHLLSSSALRGATHHKTEALRTHLRSITASDGLNTHLRNTLQEVLGGWEAVHCHPASVPVDFYPVVASSHQSH
jgi:hypothetical protein